MTNEPAPPSPKKHEPERKTRPKLTAREVRFVEEYVANGGNGSDAYRQAYPKANSATCRNNASRLLAKASVREEIAAVRREYRKQHRTTFRKTLHELSKIATADIGQIFEFTDEGPVLKPGSRIPPSARRAIASIEVTQIPAPASRSKGKTSQSAKPRLKIKVRMHDKIQALDRLCRHFGAYDEVPALEKLLHELPDQVAADIRQAIRSEIECAQGQARREPPTDPAAHTDSVPGRDVRGTRTDSRPVASKIPPELYEAADGPRVSSGGEEFCGGDEDLGPLFE